VPRLRRVDSSDPGIRRVRRGRGFSYQRQDTGRRVTDPETRARIESLAVPPAWREVWICIDDRGHLQATGYDDAGRKQYLYHEDWRKRRDREKFDRMLEFAGSLETLRAAIKVDLGLRGLVRERVLGCATRLLDLGFFRIGGEEYLADNSTYGLTTLRRRHLRFANGAALFAYRGKGSQRLIHEIHDPASIPTLRALKRNRHGSQLLVYRTGREWQPVRADDVNEYISVHADGDFTAKDFRTWNATVLAAVGLALEAPRAETKTARNRSVSRVVANVASYLGNTPTVCRSSYIDPRVVDRFLAGDPLEAVVDQLEPAGGPEGFPEREAIEEAVLRLLAR